MNNHKKKNNSSNDNRHNDDKNDNQALVRLQLVCVPRQPEGHSGGWNQLRKTEESSEGAVSRGENGLRRFLCARSMSSSLRRTGAKAQVKIILCIYIYVSRILMLMVLAPLLHAETFPKQKLPDPCDQTFKWTQAGDRALTLRRPAVQL